MLVHLDNGKGRFLYDIPSGRFGEKLDQNTNDARAHHLQPKRQSPVDITFVRKVLVTSVHGRSRQDRSLNSLRVSHYKS